MSHPKPGSPSWWQRMLPASGRGPAPVGLVPAAVLGVVVAGAIVLATATSLSTWMAIGGIAGLGALGVIAIMLYSRALQNEYRGLAAIRRALRLASDQSVGGTEQSAMALGIAPHFGPEARAFQAILSQRDELRTRLLAAATEQRLSSHGAGGGSGELAGVCDAMWVGLMLVDADFRVLYANGAAGVFLGKKRDDLMKSSLLPLLGDPRLAELIRGVTGGTVRTRQSLELRQQAQEAAGDEPAPAVEAGAERRGQNVAARRVPSPLAGGGTILRFTVRPVRRDDVGAAMIVIEDVTQQRVADEARNTFIAHATHELRTPLTNVRLYIDELVEGGDQDAALRGKCINVISQEARRLERIVGDMLSVSEIEAGSLKLRSGDVRLGPLFEELEAEYKPAAEGKGQRLVFELPPKFPVLQGDRDKIAQALHNLVGNALKYTPAGGTITLRAGEEGTLFRFDVIDNGIGVRPEEHELIFERFYRAQDKRIASITGSGLGLSLAREIARMHGGDVTIESQLDKGSTFSLRVPLPASDPGTGAAAAPAPSATPPARKAA